MSQLNEYGRWELDVGEKFYITVNKFQQAQQKHNYTKHKDLRGNPFSLKGKIMRQTLNNFTISNKDYNTQRYNLSKEKLSFSFHSVLSFLPCIFSYPLYFSLPFCLLSFTQFFKTTPVLSLTCWGFSFLWGFTSSPLLQMAEWVSFYFFIFSFFSPFHTLHIKS